MKKFLLIFTLFLSACQSDQGFLKNITKEAQLQPETHNQFDSRDLQTASINKEKTKIALLLPLTGKYKDLGANLQNAAILSLFDNDLNNNIELVTFDSKGDENEVKKAFLEIIKHNIKTVIGPVFSSEVEAIERDAKKNGIAVISFSNNQDLLGQIDNNGGIFLSGLFIESQVDKIVSYAISKGKSSFAIIAPNNQYGQTVTTIFKRLIRDRDANFITSAFYNSNVKDEDLNKIVGRAITAFSVADKLTEGGKKRVAKDVVITESDRTYPQVIFIPESGKILSRIAATIKKQNVNERDFQLAGTAQWDDITTLNDPNLIGGWFAAPETERFHNFEKTYYQLYNKFPPRIASIAYDMVGAMAQTLNRNSNKKITVSDLINYQNPPINGFNGIDGMFRFVPNGLVQRNFAMLQVGNGKFEVIDRPAEKFLKY